jgi:2,4-dienoyl-CoA reductase-like NADH-dependent reductase (Old Yellow Enzyme family)
MCGMETNNVTNNIDVLFRSIKKGSKILKNRIIMPAMGTLYAAWNGEVTQRMVEYYRELAYGGVGMVVVEYAYVHRSGQVYLGQLAIDRDHHLSNK